MQTHGWGRTLTDTHPGASLRAQEIVGRQIVIGGEYGISGNAQELCEHPRGRQARAIGDAAAADSLPDLSVDLAVERRPGIPVQHDLRQVTFSTANQSGPLEWLFSLCTVFGDYEKARRGKRMITGGNATVFVSDMDRAIRFYTETLGLKLTNRFGNNWATVEAGKGLTIGLHPASQKYPPPGTKGAIMLGMEVDEPIERVVARLSEKGVVMQGSIVRDEAGGNFAHLEDPDGNEIYLWETRQAMTPETELAGAGTTQRE